LLGILAAGMLGVTPARGGFLLGGYTPQVIQSQQGLDNAATYFQTVRTWDTSGWDDTLNGGSGGYMPVSASFTVPSNQAIPFARLYLDVYGGAAAHTAHVTVNVNGHALPIINILGTADANPTFDASKTCVYGSGVGQYQVAVSGVAGFLNMNGSANVITVTETDPEEAGNPTMFDGRLVDISLVAAYQNSSINQKLDYYLAEGDGYLRKPPANPTYGNAPAQRQVAFNGLDIANVTSAEYTALYTHGDAGQSDRLYFNGHQLGTNDVAHGQYGQYGPDLPTFDVSSYLAANSTVLYDVSTVGSVAGETSMLAKIGLLEITHPGPEPATLSLMGLGLLSLLRRRRAPA
jgi:hypothetical protein